MRIRLDISYKGTNYFGWQKQPNHPTIQEELETAILKLFYSTKKSLGSDPTSLKNTSSILTTSENTALENTSLIIPSSPAPNLSEIKTQGSGRTDAGTHAIQQVVDFEISVNDISHFDLLRGLNRYLPPDIRVMKAFEVPQDFNSLRSSISKTYVYKICNQEVSCPIRSDLTYWVRTPLDIEYLNEITSPLIGKHDFSSFQTSGTPLLTTVREIYHAKWVQMPDNEVWFSISGNGFLKQMVRNIVGTLLDGHWKKTHSPKSIRDILEAKSRPSAGTTAPAHGLYLYEVKYPEDLDKKCL